MPNSTFNTQHSTLNSTFNIQHSTFNIKFKFLVPTKTIKSPNFTLGKGEKRARVYRHPSLFHHIQDNIKKKKRKNGKQKQKQSNQPAAAPTA